MFFIWQFVVCVRDLCVSLGLAQKVLHEYEVPTDKLLCALVKHMYSNYGAIPSSEKAVENNFSVSCYALIS